MSASRNFVFLDKSKKRWKRIKSTARNLVFLANALALLAAFAVFYPVRFDQNLKVKFAKTPKEIIDLLSTRKPESIEVEGEGPFLTITPKNGTVILERQKASERKVVLLTFDDGPDPIYTPRILEILEKEGVPAIFFTIGEQLFRYPKLAQKIVGGGHQIGAHTFSHPSERVDLYSQLNKLGSEIDFPQKIIQSQTGFKTRLFRVPYWGAENTISLNSLVLLAFSFDRGYRIIQPTVDSLDWKETQKDKVVENSIKLRGTQVILLHDGGGDRSVTIAALPEIIRHYKEAGYQFKTADTFFENGQVQMPPTSLMERVTAQLAYFLFWLKRHFLTFLNPIFRLGLGLTGTSIILTLTLSIFHLLRGPKNGKGFYVPPVSVLIPAFNEEKTIEKTIESILESTYLDLEIIVIDNNSHDRTAELVTRFTDGKVKLVREKRQGKFAALNRGIKNARGKILVAVDADTQVLPNTIFELIQPFQNPRVGAVAGNLKIGNVINPLTAFQAVEYITSLHLDRRAYEILGAVPVVPGALGAWRKRAVLAAGGYKEDTLTEDADLTIRVQRAGYKVIFVGTAVGYTEGPETIQAFLKQRLRWTLGMLQVLYKHKDIYFRKDYGVLGMILLPYLTFFQLPQMLVSPIVDFLALVFLFFISPQLILLYFLAFLLLNFILTLAAFVFARETRIWLLAFLILQRIIYQGIWYYILYRSVIKAASGVFVPWMKLAHRGSVALPKPVREMVLAPEVLKQSK